jgi:methylated-DNA-[protein]-cysteine S-methyltransferase
MTARARRVDEICWCEIDSPVGALVLAASGRGLRLVHFRSSARGWQAPPDWQLQAGPLQGALAQLREYFAGRRRVFELALDLRGTQFQLAVWQALRRIPYGTTTSYGLLARELGRPEAARAVGLANGANPLPIIVPCHRVIGADGTLTGFGGGLPVKRALLQLEGAACVRDLFSTVPATPPLMRSAG